ncbi:MAG: hypothetical protein IJ724_11165, partial [Muribaculaceae bacterium]|nr:hypothetical protein [Muribaculaceae bacterium]
AEIKNDGRWPEKTPLKTSQTAVCRTARTVVWEERERKPKLSLPDLPDVYIQKSLIIGDKVVQNARR